MTNLSIHKSSITKWKEMLSALFEKSLLGYRWWARFRVIFLVMLVGWIPFTMVSMFEIITKLQIWHDIIFPLVVLNLCIFSSILIMREAYEKSREDSVALLGSILLEIGLIVFIWIEYKYFAVGLKGPALWRYLIMPVTALVGAFLAGARYIKDIYNLDDYGLAVLYLMSSFGGIGYPEIKISEGKKQIEEGKKNRLDLIGGPGHVTVSPGNVVLTERLHNSSAVHSAGNFFMPRFETIAVVLNLDDQHGTASSVSATTKDGITVTVQDIQFRYRVWAGQRFSNTTAGRNPGNPYPYTMQAIRNMAYNRNVSKDGLAPWHDAVKNAIIGEITGYIAKHQLDQITAPRYIESDPRKEISDQLQKPGFRDKLKDAGAQLLWCDIGHFEVENKAVSEQRVDTWKASWIGNANVTRAYGEAQRAAYQEIGQAEAQAEILMSIVHAFDDIDLAKKEKDRNIRNIILMRTAQVLEALASTTDDKETSPEKDTKKKGKQS